MTGRIRRRSGRRPSETASRSTASLRCGCSTPTSTDDGESASSAMARQPTTRQPDTLPRRTTMNWKNLLIALAFVGATILGTGTAHAATTPPHATLLATGLQEAIGSTIGPDGALYVAQ